MIVRLSDGDIGLGVSKVTGRHTLDEIERANYRDDHLSLRRDGNDLGVIVRPDVLFLDFKRAIARANLLGTGLAFKNLERVPANGFYGFSVADAEKALRAGGLT